MSAFWLLVGALGILFVIIVALHLRLDRRERDRTRPLPTVEEREHMGRWGGGFDWRTTSLGQAS